jgi:hypothetical protein
MGDDATRAFKRLQSRSVKVLQTGFVMGMGEVLPIVHVDAKRNDIRDIIRLHKFERNGGDVNVVWVLITHQLVDWVIADVEFNSPAKCKFSLVFKLPNAFVNRLAETPATQFAISTDTPPKNDSSHAGNAVTLPLNREMLKTFLACVSLRDFVLRDLKNE